MIKVNDYKELKTLVDDPNVYLGDLDVSAITDMSFLFEDSLRMDFSGIEKWDMRNVSSIDGMFANAQFFSHDISNWQLDSVPLQNKSFNSFIKNICIDTPVYDYYQLTVRNIVSEKEKRIINLKKQGFKLPIKAEYACLNCTRNDEINEFVNSLDDDQRLDTIDVSMCKNFSKVLKNSERSNYDGIENWVTSSAIDFTDFANGAKNFNPELKNFCFFNCKYADNFLANTDYNQNFSEKQKFSTNLNSCVGMLKNCKKFNSSLDCFLFYKISADCTDLLVGCSSFDAKNIPLFNKLPSNIALSLASTVLNIELDKRPFCLNKEQYKEDYESLINNYSFNTPLENKMVLVLLKDSELENLPIPIKSDKDLHLSELAPLVGEKHLFKSFAISKSTLKQIKEKYRSDKEFFKTFTSMELSDYVTLKGYQIDENVKFTSLQLLFITNPNEMYRDNHTNYEALCESITSNNTIPTKDARDMFILGNDLYKKGLLTISDNHKNNHPDVQLDNSKNIIPALKR